jgi:sulfur transfer complex TusBCD TusB component (DsrH family)
MAAYLLIESRDPLEATDVDRYFYDLYVVQEDLDERGIARARCVADAHPIPRREVVDLKEAHDQVWHW